MNCAIPVQPRCDLAPTRSQILANGFAPEAPTSRPLGPRAPVDHRFGAPRAALGFGAGVTETGSRAEHDGSLVVEVELNLKLLQLSYTVTLAQVHKKGLKSTNLVHPPGTLQGP